jgi:hypothetical protein
MKVARRLTPFLLLMMTLPFLPAKAGEGAFEPRDSPLTLKQVGKDAHYVFGRPAHLDRKGWAKVAWVVGIGASLYVRGDVQTLIQDHADQFSGNVLNKARKMGNAATPVATSLGFWIAGEARDSAYDKETSTLLLENLGYAAVVSGMKGSVCDSASTISPRLGRTPEDSSALQRTTS